MRNLKVYHFTRLILGGIFFTMGINGLFDIVTMKAGTPEGQEYFNALSSTKFFWPFEKSLETLFGLLLLLNRFPLVAIQGLAAIVVNIALYHIFLDPYHSHFAVVVFLCESYLYYFFWGKFFKNSFRSKIPDTELSLNIFLHKILK